MTLQDLYPYWPGTHDEIVDRLRSLTEEQLDARPCSHSAGSIRQIAARMVRHERLWIGEIVLRREPYEMAPTASMSADDLVSELVAARAATARAVAGFGPEGLRDVRVAPADPETNEIERNVPISYILWRVLEHELTAWGQIRLRLAK